MGNAVIKTYLQSLKKEQNSLNNDVSDVNKVKVKNSVTQLKTMFDTKYNSSLKTSESMRIKQEFYHLYNIIMERLNTISIPKIDPQKCNACGKYMAYKSSGSVPICRLRGDNFNLDIDNQTVISCADACYYNSKCQTAELVYPMNKATWVVDFYADKKENTLSDWTEAWCKNQIKKNIDTSSIEGTRSYYGDCPTPIGEDVPAQMILRNKNTGKPLSENVAARVAALPPDVGEKVLGHR